MDCKHKWTMWERFLPSCKWKHRVCRFCGQSESRTIKKGNPVTSKVVFGTQGVSNAMSKL